MTTTFEALDVSEYVTTTDTPEVAALKDKVQSVAKKYTDKHGWCAEVRKALREMGIESEKKIVVDVETSVFDNLTVAILPSELHGKTAQQQARTVAESFKGLALSAGSVEMKITPTKFASFITGLKVTPRAASSFESADPENRWLLLPQGRVAHLFLGYTDAAAEELWVYSGCSNVGDYYGSLKIPKADSKKCARCERRDS